MSTAPDQDPLPSSRDAGYFADPPSAPAALIAEDPGAPRIGADKRVGVRVLSATIMFVTGAYAGVDWAAYFHEPPTTFDVRFSQAARLVRTILCAVLVLLIRENHITLTDKRLLGAVFVLTVIADGFLVLGTTEPMTLIGIGLFVLIHLAYIVRHAAGFRASLEPPSRTQAIRLLILTAVVSYGGSLALIAFFFSTLMKGGKLFFAVDCVYLAVLGTSLWMAWGAMIRRAFPRWNRIFIALGMSLFYGCDVCVGLSLAAGGTLTGAAIGNLVALFYTPALVLLAYSGFRWESPARSLKPGA